MTAYRLNLLRGMAAGKKLRFVYLWTLDGEERRNRECEMALHQGHIEFVGAEDARFNSDVMCYRLTDAGRKAIEDGGGK